MNARSSHVHPQQDSNQETLRKDMSAGREAGAAQEQLASAGVPAARVVYIPRREKYKKRWYNQGWLWLLVAFAGLIVLVVGFLELSEQAGLLTDAVNDQTGAIREQTGVLHTIQAGINRMNETIRSGFDRVASLIEEAMRLFKG